MTPGARPQPYPSRTPDPTPTRRRVRGGAPHADDGLDLARALTRATAGAARPSAGAAGGAGGDQRTARAQVTGAHPDDRDPQTLDSTAGPAGRRPRLGAGPAGARRLRAVGRAGRATRWPRTPPPSPSPTAGWWCAPTPRRGRPSCDCSRPTVVRRLNEELGPRHGHRDRGPRTARPDLEEGPPLGPRRPRARATPTAEPSPGPPGQRVCGPFGRIGTLPTPCAGPPSAGCGPLRATFRPQIPPIHRVGRG